VVGLTDSNGTLVSTYQYDPYGNLLSSTGSVANPWRFAGGYFDSSTGLYKYGTRYYNPGFGRWSQQDPLRGHLDDPTSLNRYLYAGDDPVNFTDPSGRQGRFLARAVGCLAGLGVANWLLTLAGVLCSLLCLIDITVCIKCFIDVLGGLGTEIAYCAGKCVGS
jgi:RHS repeat-associated protein